MTGFLQPGTTEAPEETFRTNKLYENCCAVFEAMKERANLIEADGRVYWQGGLVELITFDLKISQSYYTAVMRALQNMNCVVQIKRGGGKSGLSVWELLEPPSGEAFLGKIQKNPMRNKTAARHGAIEQRLVIVEGQVARLMETFERILLEENNDG